MEKNYSWIKHDADYSEVLMKYEDKPLIFLLDKIKTARDYIEESIRARDFEMLERFWKVEYAIGKLLEERGYKVKKGKVDLTDKIMEGERELIDNFIRNTEERLLKEKK